MSNHEDDGATGGKPDDVDVLDPETLLLNDCKYNEHCLNNNFNTVHYHKPILIHYKCIILHLPHSFH